MQRISAELKERARSLLEEKTVDAVLGWRAGYFSYDPTPGLFGLGDLEGFTYNSFCSGNLSKYLININHGRVLALLKPCDTYGFNQLLLERRVERDTAYVLGIGCDGMIDMEKVRARGIKGVLAVEETEEDLLFKTIYGDRPCPRGDVLLEKCRSCKGKEHKVYDELIGASESREAAGEDRFAQVAGLEAMTPDQRFSFWRGELSRCIRCNACRNVCPVCSCRTCIFDNSRSGVDSKANANSFEENMFHIIRSFHVAGRCTDCGECSRVCPQSIPLHLLNRKYIKDIDSLYGGFQAGESPEVSGPLTSYAKDDAEPDIVYRKGGAR